MSLPYTGYIISQITTGASMSDCFLTGSPYNFDALGPEFIIRNGNAALLFRADNTHMYSGARTTSEFFFPQCNDDP